MNQWLHLLTPTLLGRVTETPTLEEAEIVSHHFAYLQNLREKGVMIFMGRTQNNDDKTFRIEIFEAGDESAARNIIEADPAVKAGVMNAELYPYKIALMRK